MENTQILNTTFGCILNLRQSNTHTYPEDF